MRLWRTDKCFTILAKYFESDMDRYTQMMICVHKWIASFRNCLLRNGSVETVNIITVRP